MNITNPKPMRSGAQNLKKETLQLNLFLKKPQKQLWTGNCCWQWPAVKWYCGCLESLGGQQSSLRAERVAGVGSIQGFLQWSLGGAGIFCWELAAGRGVPRLYLDAHFPDISLPGSPFRLQEGQSASQQGQCLARIIVQGKKTSRVAGFLSCLAQESMEKQLQEGEVTVMKPYWRQISVETKGNLDVRDSSSAGGSFFSTVKNNAKLHRACCSLEPASPA